MSTPASAEPRQAATVVLLRDGPRAPEVLLTIRPKHLRFMGGAAVFPGGAVAASDNDPRWRAAAGEPNGRDGDPELGAYICALRESFEEVGFLLADGPTERLRREDADEPERFLADCLTLGITLRTDLLSPAGRWVTPLGAPVRFDTHFFVARAPGGWEPVADPNEVEACMWITAAAALEGLADGSFLMAPPTVEMLQRLDGHSSVEEVIAALDRKPLTGAGNVLSVRLSPLVHVVLAPNPGMMTGPGTNTYVVGSGPHCVIDPAVDDDGYLDAILDAAGEVDSILVTHRHSDHVGGVAALASRTGATVRAFGEEPAGGVTVRPIGEGDRLDLGSARLTTLYCPGHASDHICFTLDGTASLFAGDNILGEGTAVIAPPDGNMRRYLETLERLRDLDLERIYPGHFRPLDGGRTVIEGYIAHRLERRNQVIDALRRGIETAEAIVTDVYADVGAHLHPVAVLQTEALLLMLAEEGIVGRSDDHWKLTDVD